MTLEVNVEHRLEDFELKASFVSYAPITALFGRSGAGKTSLVHIIAGLLAPTHGRIVIDGRAQFDEKRGINLPPRKRRIHYIFQEGRLFPHLTVRQNLVWSQFAPARDPYVDGNQIVQLLAMERLLSCRPAKLSGGEKQRVTIGRALLACPRLLLMD